VFAEELDTSRHPPPKHCAIIDIGQSTQGTDSSVQQPLLALRFLLTHAGGNEL
jgi:hypothetical protein